jgi:hypothetical protein
MLPIRDADRVSFAFGDFDIAGILELLGTSTRLPLPSPPQAAGQSRPRR